jgi:hypothetical protein
LWLSGLGSILALIFGLIGRQQIDRSEGRQGGRGLATAGTILGAVGIVGAVLLIAALAGAGHNSTSGNSASACRADFQTVEVAVEAYKAQTGLYPGGAPAGSSVSPGSGDPFSPGIDALLGTATSNGSTVGPWLEGAPINTNYQIVVSNDGQGTVSVYSTDPTPVQIGSTNSSVDCDSVP